VFAKVWNTNLGQPDQTLLLGKRLATKHLRNSCVDLA